MTNSIASILLAVPVILFSMVAHEYAHGYAALRQGDPTAYQLGRLTWNPIKHIDPFMTILLPLMTGYFLHFPFGGAKPVPVNPRNYRKFKRGDIIVSLAGIAANTALAVLFTLLVILIGLIARSAPAGWMETLALLQVMLVWGILFNVLLAVFNLLPIPPLDGSHVMKYLLPPAWSLRYQQAGRFGLLIVFAVAFLMPSLFLVPVSGVFSLALRVFAPFALPGVLGAL
ncbi:MAG TPA: site-2 protease family protein [Gemmatimonadaceae bacterium]|nr:site-2 protease family protein [Gemmatimonadaceae bacterium]